MGNHDGQRPTTLDPRERTRSGKMHHTRVDSGQTRKALYEETDVNSEDLQVFVRCELEALAAGIGDLSSDLSSVFTHEESAELENAAMELSAVPDALMTVRAASDKMKGKSESKSEPTVSFSGKSDGKWRKPKTFARQVGCEKS